MNHTGALPCRPQSPGDKKNHWDAIRKRRDGTREKEKSRRNTITLPPRKEKGEFLPQNSKNPARKQREKQQATRPFEHLGKNRMGEHE